MLILSFNTACYRACDISLWGKKSCPLNLGDSGSFINFVEYFCK